MILTLEMIVTLIIDIACVLVEVLIAISLSRKWLKYRPKTLAIFLLALLALIFADSSALVAMFLTDQKLLIFIYKFSLIGSMVSICLLLFFFEAFEYSTIFTWKQTIHTMFLGGTVIAIMPGSFQTVFLTEIEVLIVSLDPLTDFLTQILPGLGSLFIILSLRKGYPEAWHVQKRQLRFMIIGISIAYFLPILLRPLIPIFSSMVFTVFLRADVAIGFILYFVSFGKAENFSLYSRHQADRILVIDENGLPLFSYDFKFDSENLDDALFAGGIVAITSFMKEATKSSASISEIKLEDKQLFLEIRPSIQALILSPRSTVYLKEALKRFANGFEEEFKTLLQAKGIVNTENFSSEGKKLVYESFGIS